MYLKNGATRRKQECRTGLPQGGQDLLVDADVALLPYVATVTIKARTRGQMLMSRSQLSNTQGQEYARAIR
jgi:hypothetical protein